MPTAESMLTIVGDLINLREFRPDDGPWVARAAARGQWWRWDAPWEGRPLGEEMRRISSWVERVRKEQAVPPLGMVIETRAGRPVGTVSRCWVDERAGWLEVGIGIFSSRNWGKGFGVEAVALWADHLFAELPLHRIGLRTWSGNTRMIRVALRAGFKQEATFREAYRAAGRAYDRIAFGLLRREWEKRRAGR